MQYFAFHSIQGMYFAVISQLFGSKLVEAELTAAGAVIGAADYNVHIGGVRVPNYTEIQPKAARRTAGLSRPAWETILRKLVASDAKAKGIEFIDGTVTGLDVDPANPKRLTGVRYRPTDDAKATLSVQGDLVIGKVFTTLSCNNILNLKSDCSGVSHSGVTLLQKSSPAFDLPKSMIESYQPNMRYASCTFSNSNKVLEPFFEAAADKSLKIEVSSPFPYFFVPIASIDDRWFGFARVENDKRKSLSFGLFLPITKTNSGLL
jgi:hypothetical protein